MYHKSRIYVQQTQALTSLYINEFCSCKSKEIPIIKWALSIGTSCLPVLYFSLYTLIER